MGCWANNVYQPINMEMPLGEKMTHLEFAKAELIE